MNYLNIRVFCYTVLLFATFNQVIADVEERGDEIVQGNKSYENISSAEAGGPPDSHEAMNNRMINPNLRAKRSYEFLMGLINNNSKYEITKVDPSEIVRQPHQSKIAASELLLDLMVKIAAYSDHWDKVYKLLQKIDSDLLTSKKIMNDLENNYEESSNKVEFSTNTTQQQQNKTINNKWPSFDKEEAKNNNNKFSSSKDSSPYPKTFAYHRVTRRPSYLNKTPKAYIAVSVIAPKPPYQEDEINLENELHQLKPWIYKRNK